MKARWVQAVQRVHIERVNLLHDVAVFLTTDVVFLGMALPGLQSGRGTSPVGVEQLSRKSKQQHQRQQSTQL